MKSSRLKKYREDFSLGNILLFIGMLVIMVLFWVSAIYAVYLLKSDMGIDLFSNFHLSDLVVNFTLKN